MTEPYFSERSIEDAATALDGVHSAMIVGSEPDRTAEAALAIARVHARRRRVAVADLFGELPAFERLLPGDVEHGIVDSFAYGVSLTQIAQPVDAARNLFILPSGAGSMDRAAILTSDRWSRLASGFREVGALLLVVVPAHSTGMSALLARLDGVVVVGDVEVPQEFPLLSRIQAAPLDNRSVAEDAVVAPATVDAVSVEPAAGMEEHIPLVRRLPRGRELTPILGAAAALLILAALGALLLGPMRSNAPPAAETALADQAAVSTEAEGATEPALDTLPTITVANPLDSASATAYSVQLASHTGQTSALAHVESAADRAVPAVTFSPLITGAANARWYRVLAGAYGSQAGADSLLGLLRRRGSLEATQGEVRYAPYALVLERAVARDQMGIYIRDYRSRGIPAYGLMQADGTVHLYAGAFETPEQASLLLATLRERGEEPQVVFRMGRAF